MVFLGHTWIHWEKKQIVDHPKLIIGWIRRNLLTNCIIGVYPSPSGLFLLLLIHERRFVGRVVLHPLGKYLHDSSWNLPRHSCYCKKSIFATLFQTRKKHRCTSPHGLNRLTPHGEQYIFGSRSCFVLQLITTWMVEKCKLFVFYHVFEKHFMLQESNKELSKTGWVLQFGAPSWISNIIGKLGGCLKEFVIFSQFVVEWRNTTLTDGSVNFCKIRKFCFDDRILVPIDSFHPNLTS